MRPFTTKFTQRISLKTFSLELSDELKKLKNPPTESTSSTTEPTGVDSKAKNQLVKGDIHGNTKLLVKFLREEGILEIDDKDYARIYEIYHTDNDKLTEKDLNDFYNIIIDKAKITDKPFYDLLTLLGDMLADRGQNDYFTLIVLEKLRRAGIPYEILLSNHDVRFVRAIEQKQAFPDEGFMNIAYGSMWNLQLLINKGLIKRDNINQLYDLVYKPCLKLLSYTLSEDEKRIVIYSHGNIGQATIAAVAKVYEVEYKDGTPKELAETIDRINIVFRQKADQNKITELFQDVDAYNLELDKHPIDSVINEMGEIAADKWEAKEGEFSLPGRRESEAVQFCHGHDAGANGKTYAHKVAMQAYLKQEEQSEYTRPKYGSYAVNPYVHDLDTNNTLGKALTAETGDLQTLGVHGIPMPQAALAPLSVEEQKLLASYRKQAIPVAEEKEKVKLPMTSTGPTLFTAMDIKEATVILKQNLATQVGKQPGWIVIPDSEGKPIFEIGVSRSEKKPGFVYNKIQIQFEGATSPLTVLNKDKIIEVNGKKVFETVTGAEAEKQIIAVATAIKNFKKQPQKVKEDSGCLTM